MQHFDSREFELGVKKIFGVTSDEEPRLNFGNRKWISIVHDIEPSNLNIIHNMMALMSLGNGPCWLSLESDAEFSAPIFDFCKDLVQAYGIFPPEAATEGQLHVRCDKLDDRIGPLLVYSMLVGRDITLFVEKQELVVSINHENRLKILARSESDLEATANLFWLK